MMNFIMKNRRLALMVALMIDVALISLVLYFLLG